MNINPYFEQIESTLWQGRTEVEPLQRIYQKIEVLNENVHHLSSLQDALCIMGFATDIGVMRNQGRTGAKAGPNIIRQMLANLPYHPVNDKKNMKILDLGNINCPDNDLEAAQQKCAAEIVRIHEKKGFSLILGGGHEIAWAHYLGLKDSHQVEDFAIVNFDAHFDMRPLVNGLGNSGTSFLQIAEHRRTLNHPFHYYCFGIRTQSNTQSLFETARKWNVNYLTCDDIYQQSSALNEWVEAVLSKHQHIYLTVCMDVFSASVAPGVSANSPYGLMPWQVLPMIDKFAHSGQVIAMDIAEYAPSLDQDYITAKLAALIAANFINQYSR